jgi:hypothetical protein
MGRLALLAVLVAVAPPGFRTHAISGAGVSVALPVGWQTLTQRDAAFPGVRQILTRTSPRFALPLRELAVPDSPLKLFAFDRRFHGHPTTVMVVQERSGRVGAFNSWAPRMAAALRHAPGIRGPLHMHGVDLASGTALWASYRTADHDTVVVYVVGGGRNGLWALLLRTPTARAGRDASLFGRVARSLELRTPVGGASKAPSPPGA